MAKATFVLALFAALGLTTPANDIGSVEQRDVQQGSVLGSESAILERDSAVFTLGYALCSFTTCVGSHCMGGSREDAFVWGGQTNVGCNQHNDAHIYDGTDYNKSKFTIDDVCKQKIDFYRKGNNYDFYENSGDGTLLGTCYPADGSIHNCLDVLAGGSCAVRPKLYCYAATSAAPRC